MLASCSYALPLARTLSWCSVCATAHLPNVVLVGACGPALSELVGSSENVQFSGCGTESQGGTYWVRRYAARELRFSVLTVPVKREVVSLTTTGPFTVCGSFSFAQTELLSSSHPTHPCYGADR